MERIQLSMGDLDTPDCWACGYCDSKISLYSVGMLGCAISSSMFLALASRFKVPVSSSHSIIGAIFGMTIVAVGFDCIDWSLSGSILPVIISWFVSPVLAALIAAAVFLSTKFLILDRDNPTRAALRAVPILFALLTALIVFTILKKNAFSQVRIIINLNSNL